MRSLIKALIRVIIILMFLNSLLYFVRYANDILINLRRMGETNVYYEFGILLVSCLLGVLILYFLWRKSDWLVEFVAGEVSENELSIKTSNVDLMQVLMCLLGIYLLVNSIPDFIALIGYHLSLPPEELGFNYSEQHANEVKQYITIGIKIIFGFWLMLGTKGLVKAIGKVDDRVHMIEDKPENEE